ncbi:MAG: MFS transporter [Geodermatophilaceae bacterium]|nr:MFS transporter [Geodermatophilaceae bacterium]
MASLISDRGARLLFFLSILARLPLAMFSIGLLVHAEHLTSSFAAAGAVTGAYAVALGVGGPLLGRLVDQRGQRLVLLASAVVGASLLGVIATLPVGTPTGVLVVLAGGIGFATPPVGACLRTLLPAILPDARQARAAYALEATAVELTWVSGPPLALALGALWSTGTALALGGFALLAATAAFAWQPASHEWRPAADAQRLRGGSLRSPAIRTLIFVLLAVGVLFGAVEVGAAAAAQANGGSTAAAAPLLALWGVGSLIGGLVAARLGGGPTSAAGLALVLGALAVGHLTLVSVAGSNVALGVVLFVAGTAIAPTYAAVYAMVDQAAPAGTVTEAFAWLATAVGIGAAAGAAGAGVLTDHKGPVAAFALAGAAGAMAALCTTIRSRTLLPGAARTLVVTVQSD